MSYKGVINSNPPPSYLKPPAPKGPPPLATAREDSTRSAGVDHSYHWIKINARAPLRKKLQLINRPSGVATYGELTHTGEQFWTHYALLPTFDD